MRKRIGLAALLLVGASLASAHEQVPFDTRRPTPGLVLELVRIAPTSNLPSETVRYRLQASGLPRDVGLGVWARDFGHGFHQIATDLRMDQSGAIVSSEPDGAGRRQPGDALTIEPGPYPPGAVWEVALASVDLTLTAFAKVIPHPLVGRDGPCTLSLELASRRGERFVASGTGFSPSEDVVTDLRYSGLAVRKTQRVSPEGLLPPSVIAHNNSSSDHGATYKATGRSCEVTIEYEWGEPALRPR
jgi:hypothetical protein